MPYLYSVVRETCDTGLPIVRALWLHYPLDRDGRRARRRVPVGPRHPRRAGRRKGRDEHEASICLKAAGTTSGRKTCTRADAKSPGTVDLETMPLFVRAGAILPLGPVRQYTTERSDEPLTLQRLSRRERRRSRCTKTTGDRSTTSAATGWAIDVRWTDAGRRLALRLTPGSRLRPPAERRFRVRAAGSTSTREVRFTGAPIEVRL